MQKLLESDVGVRFFLVAILRSGNTEGVQTFCTACREEERNSFSKAKYSIGILASVKGSAFTPSSSTDVFSIISRASQG